MKDEFLFGQNDDSGTTDYYDGSGNYIGWSTTLPNGTSDFFSAGGGYAGCGYTSLNGATDYYNNAGTLAGFSIPTAEGMADYFDGSGRWVGYSLDCNGTTSLFLHSNEDLPDWNGGAEPITPPDDF